MNFYSIWLAVSILAIQAGASEIRSRLQGLSSGLGAQTNIFFYTKNVSSLEYLLKSTTNLPKVLITEGTSIELRQYFSTKVLTVVLLEQEEQFKAIRGTFKSSLNRWHKTDVLFVTTSRAQAAFGLAHVLFSWCWTNGFYNVLLYTDDDRLLSIDPFPQLQVIDTTVARYLLQRNRWRDFQGYPIRVIANHSPPHGLIYTDKRTDQLVISGLAFLMVEGFAAFVNATLLPRIYPYGDYSFNTCLQGLHREGMDICGVGHAMISGVIVNRPLLLIERYLLVPAPQPIPKFRYFIVPFSWDVWLLTCSTICYITISMSFLSWLQGRDWQLGEFSLEAISCVLFLSFRLSGIHGLVKYYLFSVLTVAGFILSSLYLALLSGMLTTSVFERNIKSAEDLVTRNISIMVTCFEPQIYKMYGGEESLLQQFVPREQREYRAHHDHLHNGYAYIDMDDVLKYYLHQQKFLKYPLMKTLEKPLYMVIGGLPMWEYWPFEEMFNEYHIRSFEAGLLLYAKERVREEGVRMGDLHFFQTESYGGKPLSTEFFEMPALLLAVGYLLALLSFILERIFFRRRNFTF